jgi:hypothetical protein
LVFEKILKYLHERIFLVGGGWSISNVFPESGIHIHPPNLTMRCTLALQHQLPEYLQSAKKTTYFGEVIHKKPSHTYIYQ